MLTMDQIAALGKRVDELKGYLGVEQKRMEIAEDEKLTQDPEFWNDPKEAEKVMKRMRTKKGWVESYDSCASAVEDVTVLHEFMKAGEAEESEVNAAFESAQTAVEELEFKNMLSAEEDSLNAVMQITSAPAAQRVATGPPCSCGCTGCTATRTASRSRNSTFKTATWLASSR